MFHDRGTPDTFIRNYQWRGIPIAKENIQLLWELNFFHLKKNEPIHMEVHWENGKDSLTIEEIKIDKDKILQTINLDEDIIENKYPVALSNNNYLRLSYLHNDLDAGYSELYVEEERISIKNEKLFNPNKKIILYSSNMLQNPHEIASLFSSMDVEDKVQYILKILNIIEPKISSLSLVQFGKVPAIYGSIGLSKKMPVQTMGDGIVKLLSIILCVASNENGILLIDEIENGWHWSVLPKIWKALIAAGKEYNCQIIATTHSYEVMESIKAGLDTQEFQNISYIRLDNENGKIVAKIYSPDVLEAAIDMNMEIR
jgi:AAA15 family ATPase/GTPase